MRSLSRKLCSQINLLGENRNARRRRQKLLSNRRLTLESLEARALLTAVVVNSVSDDSTPIAGQTTLRDAINAVNASTDATNTISFDPTVFSSPQTITLTNGSLDLLKNMTITGPAGGVTVSGNKLSTVFVIGNSGTSAPSVELADLTISDGYNSNTGGGILNNTGSSLTVLNSTISGNNSKNGGGLYNNGTVALTNCTLTGNIGYDGAALKDFDGATTLTNCTIGGNTSYDGGGAIDTFGKVVLNNAIVANNISSTWSTLSFYIQGSGTITGSKDLVYDNADGGASSGASLTNSTANAANPLLGNLGNYGGPTETIPLLAGSPAIDAGSNALIAAGVTTDQRGLPRVVGGSVDVGAFELQNPESILPVVTIARPSGTPVYGQQETFTASVTFGGAPLAGGTVNFLEGSNVLASNLSLNSAGRATFQSSLLSAGPHTITARYNGSFGFAASDTVTGATVDVAKANATIVVTPYSITYDGNAHSATGAATGFNSENLAGELDLSGTTHTNAGTYNGDAWSFSGDNNYNPASGTVDDAIAKANATIVVTPYSVTYDGNAHTAAGAATGVQGEDLSGELSLSGTTHTGAGAYSGDAWSFSGDANYNPASGTVDDAIAKANATIVVTPYSIAYDGNAHTATGTATGVNSEDLTGELDLSGTTHTNAGAYSGDAWSFSGDSNYNPASGTVDDAIAKASPSLTNVAAATSDPVLGATTVVLGTGDSLTSSAILTGGVNDAGTITFALLDPNGNTAYSDTVTVSGNASYNSGMPGTIAGSPVPSLPGTYQWAVSYSGDGNNDSAGPASSVQEAAVGPGAAAVGGALYLVGGATNDQVFISPTGKSWNGSTGVLLWANLNGIDIDHQTFGVSPNAPITSIIVSGFGGNDNLVELGTLTIPTTVVEGDGNDNIALGNSNSSVLAGDGNDTIFAAGGNNTVTAGNGNDNVQIGFSGLLAWLLPSTPPGNNTITLGNGNDHVSAGDGDNIVTIGNGHDNVNLGDGDNQVTVQGGQPATPANQRGGWQWQPVGGANIQLGNGNNTVTAGDSNINVSAGSGRNAITAGDGNDQVQVGDGDNHISLGNGQDSVWAGDGYNTIVVGNGGGSIEVGDGDNVIVAGSGNNNIQAGDGDNLIVGGTGRDSMRVGNGNNVLIDGALAQTTDQLWDVLDLWMKDIAVGDASQIANDLAGGLPSSAITYNTSSANTLSAGRGFDAFFANYGKDHVNAKPGDLVNGNVVRGRGH